MDRSGEQVHPIERLRVVRGWSRARLARELGVHPHAVRGWEAGALPRMDRLQRLADVFGLDHRRLLADIVTWRSGARDRGSVGSGVGSTESPTRRLATDFNNVYDSSDGAPSPAVLATFATMYDRLDREGQDAFRARIIGHMARSLAPIATSPLSYASRVADGWFPRSA